LSSSECLKVLLTFRYEILDLFFYILDFSVQLMIGFLYEFLQETIERFLYRGMLQIICNILHLSWASLNEPHSSVKYILTIFLSFLYYVDVLILQITEMSHVCLSHPN